MMHRSTRPRLRTKTGCLTCRRQKKKCDEQKPSCRDCSQNKRVCIWPTVFADGRHGKRALRSASPTPTSSSNSSTSESTIVTSDSCVRQCERSASKSPVFNEHHIPSGPITWYPIPKAAGPERLLFHHFSTCVLPTAIRAHAHPVYAAYKDVYQLGFQMPEIMNVFLGIAALRIGQNKRNSATQATELYITSVNAVCRSIRERKVNGTEEWLLVWIAFMVVFETSKFDLSSDVMLHLEGLAQIFRIRKLKHTLPDPEKPFHRIVAEAFTYHLATYSLLYGRLDRIAQQFSWSDLEAYEAISPCPEASGVASSPILGSQFELFKLIFEITRLSRHTPLIPSDLIKAVEYKRQLNNIQQRLTQALNFADEGDEHESREGALLYTLASQLFLFKVMNPEVDTDDPTIRHILTQALLFVDKCRITTAFNSYFCWPLTILACAVRTEEEKEVIERKMMESLRWTFSGQIHRTSSLIKAIWEDESSDDLLAPFGNNPVPRGLGRLIHKEGLADTLLYSRSMEIES